MLGDYGKCAKERCNMEDVKTLRIKHFETRHLDIAATKLDGTVYLYKGNIRLPGLVKKTRWCRAFPPMENCPWRSPKKELQNREMNG
jgi:hypothetical protein